MKSRAWIAIALAVAAIGSMAVTAGAASAAPGKLDRSFGGGIVSVQPPLTQYSTWYPQQSAAGPKGRVYVLEESMACRSESEPATCTGRIFVTRYLKNGTRDTSYGQGGTAVALSGRGAVPPGPPAFAVDADGRAVIAVQNGSAGLVVARLDPEGALDVTFGEGGGRALACQDCLYDEIHLFLDSKGKILLAAQQSTRQGAPNYGPGDLQGALFMRLTMAGAVDPSYGDGGQVFVPQMALTEAIGARANGAIVAATGKFLTKVSASGDAVDRDFAVQLRLREVRRYEGITAMPNGDLIVIGSRRGGFVARLRPSGALVRSFGKKGLAQFPKRELLDVSVDGSDRILLMGGVRSGPFLMRLSPKGRVQSQFRNGLAGIDSFGGYAESFYSGAQPMVFAQGGRECRTYCQPHPLLFKFLGGSGKRKSGK